jgi:hypothetical protein
VKLSRARATVLCLRDARGSGWGLVALTVFKTVRDLTLSGWVGSIPIHSRHSLAQRFVSSFNAMRLSVPDARRLIQSSLIAIALGAPAVLAAQKPDSARRVPRDTVPVRVAPRDSAAARPVPRDTVLPVDTIIPPISPGRAFFYSFALPGYGQSKLGRHKAAAAFVFVEAMSLVMIRESAADVHEARRSVDDTVVVSYVDASGNLLTPAPSVVPRYSSAEIHSRLAHVEDWIALLVANHLFSGADAFVAAHLWDVPSHVAFRVLPNSRFASLSASFRW